ncbi:uncharacterized protein LOC105700904 isoform X1 [Orussus abietinus]|uniref:uncharacterized protein LOC105700904 isoform X1 n=1 Tax=Orussus abietinus TaxID=222816 RepID=UPI0006251352|nr:uncharacterized protein LOC105700904 isoform X1 [Orussus abietinus]
MLIAISLLLVALGQADVNVVNGMDLKCTGRPRYNVSLTAYYPIYDSPNSSDYLDIRGKKLRSLQVRCSATFHRIFNFSQFFGTLLCIQDYIDGRGEYVTGAMDSSLNLVYGTPICIPELNEHFGRQIPIQVRDRGSNLDGKEFSRLDICVRSEVDSYDNCVNRLVTVYM